MGKYSLELKKSAVKELKKIPNKYLKVIIEKIRSLSDEPKPIGCVKLSDKERYRIRVGNHRISYSIEEDTSVVCVVKIGHRKDVYR